MKQWQQDKYLRNMMQCLHVESARLISFDIFDTVLFRTVSSPGRIFYHAGVLLNEKYPKYDIPAEVFAGMRAEAEDLARKKAWDTFGYEDVTLDEIYGEFQFAKIPGTHAMECELEAESQNIFLNYCMESFIRNCKESGKHIAMVSDTYFNHEQITKFLAVCGFDISMIDAFVISCEQRCLKHNGKLFSKLLDTFPNIAPYEILHIGDNKTADIGGASIESIRTSYYGAIPRSAFHPLSVEPGAYHTVEPIMSLRKLACSLIPAEYEKCNTDVTLFETGASVFGPVYATFVEWIIQQCKKNGIRTILAFMREGQLLAELINQATKHCGLNIVAKPIYISRRTTEIVGLDEINSTVIEEYIHRGGLTLSDLFSIFYLDIGASPFSSDADCTIGQYKDCGKFVDLHSFFTNPSTLAIVNESVSKQRELLIDYILSLTCGEKAATVDVGFRGTMQACLTDIKANGDAGLLHLMMMGLPYNNRFLLRGIHLHGWLGYGNENQDAIERVYRRIQVLEAVTNADVGTTLAYERKDGMIVPVLECVSIDEENRRKKSIIRQGILCYQDYWFSLVSEKPQMLEEVISNKTGFLGILSRLLMMPDAQEATVLGSLYYDESILNSEKSSVIKPADYHYYDECDSIEEFISACLSHKFIQPVYWPEGIAVIKNPDFYIESAIKITGGSAYKKVYDFLTGACLKEKRVGIYGAGAVGVELTDAMCSLGVEVAYLIDNNPVLQGRSFSGVKVISPQESAGNVDVYIVTPLRFEKEIYSLLSGLTRGLPERPKIITYR